MLLKQIDFFRSNYIIWNRKYDRTKQKENRIITRWNTMEWRPKSIWWWITKEI